MSAHLATSEQATPPPLAEPLRLIQDALTAAADPRLGSDHRARYLWDAVALQSKLLAYLLEREHGRAAAERRREGR